MRIFFGKAPLYVQPGRLKRETPMTRLYKIRLELGRVEGFPQGSSIRGYVFTAPLTDAGHIDALAWKSARQDCKVLRYWGDEAVQRGMLRHVGHGWRFDYETGGGESDEPFFKLDKHVIKPGGYVSITEQDRVQRPFRIVSVVPVRAMEKAA
jgi:hypothetical protein